MAEDRGPQAAGAAGLFLALSWIFVSLRCYCRIALLRAFAREDYLCVITQVIPPLLDLGDIEAEQPRYCSLSTAR